jgi:hypothetical protein
MPLPPNWLTVLFYGKENFPYPGVPEAPRTPEEMWRILKDKGCLSEEGLTNSDGMVQLIRATQRQYEDEESRQTNLPSAGPGEIDWIAGALLDSPYLNDEAHRLYDTPLSPDEYPETEPEPFP